MNRLAPGELADFLFDRSGYIGDSGKVPDMIDLHTHSFLSDGVLIPSELARRAEVKGYTHLGISDHVDMSNLEDVIAKIKQAAEDLSRAMNMTVLPGAELTHVPPALIPGMAVRARALGVAYLVVHGETPVEPVAPGTNRAAIEAKVDILAHPGLITAEEAALAAKNSVCLEITTRKGHSLTNGHVARTAGLVGAQLVLNTDAHAPEDLVTLEFARLVALGAGLNDDDFRRMQTNALEVVNRRHVRSA